MAELFSMRHQRHTKPERTRNQLQRDGDGDGARQEATAPLPSGRRQHQGTEERQLFDEAYRTLFATVFRVAYRISGDTGLAEDLTHEAFLQLLRAERLPPTIAETKYWLLRVVRNLSLNLETRRGRERRAYQRAQHLMPDQQPSTADEAVAAQLRSEVQLALDSLPPEMRTILTLREYGDLSYREIASVMLISESNVKVRLHRARQRMAVALGDVASQ
jgi:RNA polymerase sigma-70 factor (ECF subfamily)